MAWTASPSGKAVTRVDFSIDGSVKWSETGAPWVFNGDGRTLDTTTLANGSHVLSVTALATDGSTKSSNATVSVSNGSAKPSVAGAAQPVAGKTAVVSPQATPAAATPIEMKSYVIEWDGRLFPSMGAFRSYVVGLGKDWSGFLARHPGVAARTGLPYVQWDGEKHYDQASLVKHLGREGVSYRRWASEHPEAAATLAGRPVAGAQRTVAEVLQKPVVITWAGVGFTTATGLRSHLARNGRDWNVFLVGHPAAAKRLGLASVTWEGEQFYTRAALSQWLADHKVAFAQWQKTHPGLAEKLMA